MLFKIFFLCIFKLGPFENIFVHFINEFFDNLIRDIILVEQNMQNSSSCGGSYIHYDMEVSCPSCGRVMDTKLSTSSNNSERLFNKCSQCGKFVKWAKPMEDRQRLLDEEE